MDGWGLKLAVVALALLAACTNTSRVEPADEQPTTRPTAKPVPATGIRRGINLGNWLEAPSPGEWGVDILPEYFTHIRQAGFDSVRIPVRFSAHAQTEPPYSLDEDFMEIVDAAIQHGLESGLNVILDFHHYDELMAAPAAHEARFLAIWGQLAERYAGSPETLYFELLNEPYGRLDADTWNDLLVKVVEVIRASNPDRWIIIGGADYSHIRALRDLRLPEDEHLIATFHFYEPFEFTHQGASWVPGSQVWAGTKWKWSEKEKKEITDLLDEADGWSRLHGIPLVMGEYGAIARADESSRRAWTAFVTSQAGKRGIPWIYWDFCGEFAVFNCESGEWDQSILDALTGK